MEKNGNIWSLRSKASFLFALLLLPLATLLAQGEIFLTTLGGQLYNLDLQDCSFELVGDMPIGSTDISFHPNGNFYAIGVGGELYEVDVVAGSSSLIHTFTGPNEVFTALTVSAEGDFYASGLQGNLFRFNLGTGNSSFLGNVGAGAEGDLTFYEGELYMAATDDRIIKVNTQIPLNSTVAINADVPGRIFGIVSYAESCDSVSVYALTNQSATIYEVDLVNNVLTEFCNIPLQVSGGASTFEFLGSNPISIEEPVANNFDCDAATGVIDVQASGGVGQLTYSLDGINFQTNSAFFDLPVDNYTVYVQDEVGCVRTLPFSPNGGPLRFTSSDFGDTSCGLDNGFWTNEVAGGIPSYTFRLNDSISQDNGNFDNLAAGDYELVVTSVNSCTLSSTISIAPSELFALSIVDIIPASCGQANGSIELDGSGGSEPYTFTLNGVSYTDPEEVVALFRQLPAGAYNLSVTDFAGCQTAVDFVIPGSPALELDLLNVQAADCGQANGSAVIDTTGSGPIRLSAPLSATFNGVSLGNLAPGSQSFIFINESGCTDTLTFSVPSSRCPVYVPTAFSPNLDGINDFFAVFAPRNSGITIRSFQIFDRWGGLVHEQFNGQIGDQLTRWDGSRLDRPVTSGTYAYQIVVEYGNGETEVLAGSVELVR